ncbi:MAG: hypothetical protein WCP32_06815 [Bacteroidota bacterium]
MNKSRLIIVVVLALLGILFFVTTCYRGGQKNKMADLPPGTHGVTVKEVIQTSNYSYLNVEENDKMFWIAVVSRQAKPGDVIYYTKSYEMNNFVSKELKRTFSSVLFIEDPTDNLASDQKPGQKPMTAQKPTLTKWSDVAVITPTGGITIGDLYKNPGSYSGKQIIIRGVVTKFNSQIMGKNWLHIQDGTNYEGKFDLTVTTMDSLIVGKTATFKGVITLNKDFGSGYFYDVIMEEGTASDIK